MNTNFLRRFVTILVAAVMVGTGAVVAAPTIPKAAAMTDHLYLSPNEGWVNHDIDLKIYSSSSASGSDLDVPASVKFDGQAMSGVGIRRDARGVRYISATASAKTVPGTYTVRVNWTGSPWSPEVELAYHVIARPDVTELYPSWAQVGESKRVRLTGKGFLGVTGVLAGGTLIPVVPNSDSLIWVSLPASGEAKDVYLVPVRPSGLEGGGMTFRYLQKPSVQSINPSDGPASGGTHVIVGGSGLDLVEKLEFGGKEISFSHRADGGLQFFTPLGTPGSKAEITLSGSRMYPYTPSLSFTYLSDEPYPITYVSMAPAEGVASGGTRVEFTSPVRFDGPGLGVIAILFNGNPGTDFSLSPRGDKAWVATPPGVPGDATVLLVSEKYTYDPGLSFRYTVPPTPVEITGPSQGTRTTPLPMITGKGAAGIDVSVKATASQGGKETTLGSTKVQTDSTWQLTPVNPLAPGKYTLIAADQNGESKPWTITVSDPVVVTYPSEGGRAPVRPTLAGTAHPQAKLTVTDRAGGTVLGSGVADKNGRWSVKIDRRLSPGLTQLTVSDEIGLLDHRSFTAATAPNAAAYIKPFVKVVDSLPTRR